MLFSSSILSLRSTSKTIFLCDGVFWSAFIVRYALFNSIMILSDSTAFSFSFSCLLFSFIEKMRRPTRNASSTKSLFDLTICCVRRSGYLLYKMFYMLTGKMSGIHHIHLFSLCSVMFYLSEF